MKASLLLLLPALLTACVSPARTEHATITLPAPAANELRLAFGSCNRHDLPQPLWDDIAATQPQVWIWLGDNIYGDSDDAQVLRAKYRAQQQQPGYQQLQAGGTAVIGTWDDHDYGRNDGDKNYPFKAQNQQLALDFLGEPAASPRRRQEGIYASYTYPVGAQQVKVILLDDRYFQDSLYRDLALTYHPNLTGDLLGEAQWQWLEQQLTNSSAAAHVIGSGIQFLPTQHRYEKWSNFPRARQRLLDLLRKTQPAHVVLISGDRHLGEMSQVTIPGLAEPVYEVTSSGLTHPATQNHGEPNDLRVGPLINQKHFGLLRFQPDQAGLRIEASLRGDSSRVFYTRPLGAGR